VTASSRTHKDRDIPTLRADVLIPGDLTALGSRRQHTASESKRSGRLAGIGGFSGLSAQRLGLRPALLLLTLAVGTPLDGSAQDSLFNPPASHVVRWWHGALAIGALSGLMFLDKPVQRFAQDNRTPTGNDVARAFRHFGQPEIYGTVTLGMVAAGLISGEDEVTRAGGRLAVTLALAGATTTLGKFALGRPRPSESLDADGFKPFSGQDAMPSGHATMAFALATALSDDIRNAWASVGLYTVATGVAWSRVNDDRHWLTDVSAGALVGIASAKLTDGRWRVFNLHPPRLLIGPGQAKIVWRTTF
jgi:membrane-associated phospholipid phosphatase